MEIKEPKFREGQKVRYVEDGNIYTIECVNSYSFKKDEYSYNILERLCTLQESNLELYIEKPKTVWDLKNDDKCYFVTVVGHIFPGTWNNLNAQIENIKLGNFFLTKQDAEYDLERRKIENEMLSLRGRRTFKKGEDNYYIFCDFSSQYDVRIYKEKDGSFGKGMIYFDSIKDVSNAIDSIGVDRIKKYYFGVDE